MLVVGPNTLMILNKASDIYLLRKAQNLYIKTQANLVWAYKAEIPKAVNIEPQQEQKMQALHSIEFWFLSSFNVYSLTSIA